MMYMIFIIDHIHQLIYEFKMLIFVYNKSCVISNERIYNEWVTKHGSAN